MTAFVVQFEDTEVRAALDRLVARGDDLRPVFEEIGAELKRTTRLRFDNEEDPQGRRWDPLSKAYAEWKSARHKPVDKILHFNLELRDTIHTEVTEDSLTIAAGPKYARAQQLGYAPRNLPARPFLGISDEDVNFILEALNHAFDPQG